MKYDINSLLETTSQQDIYALVTALKNTDLSDYWKALGEVLFKILSENGLKDDFLRLSRVSKLTDGVVQRVDEDNLPDELPLALREKFGETAADLFGKENNLRMLKYIYQSDEHTSSTRLIAAKNVFYEKTFSLEERVAAANEYVSICVSKGKTNYFSSLSTVPSLPWEVAEIFKQAARTHYPIMQTRIVGVFPQHARPQATRQT
ncbi:MAG: hypothetical protein QW568_03765, partial [Candidatus Anstonellaceae archaeon]